MAIPDGSQFVLGTFGITFLLTGRQQVNTGKKESNRKKINAGWIVISISLALLLVAALLLNSNLKYFNL